MKLNDKNVSYKDLDTSYLEKDGWERRVLGGVLGAKRVGTVEEVLEGLEVTETKKTEWWAKYESAEKTEEEKQKEEEEKKKEEERKKKEEEERKKKGDDGYEEVVLYYNGEKDYIDIGTKIGGLMTDFKGFLIFFKKTYYFSN